MVTVFSVKVTATSARSVFNKGASALISTTCETSPTSNFRSARENWSTETETFTTAALNPLDSTRTWYVPAINPRCVKFPSSFVVVVTLVCRCVSVITTRALATAAPAGSTTVPTMFP